MNEMKSSVKDYNLFGIVSLRLINPGKNDEQNIDDYLGQFKNKLEGNPDIIIEYKDKLNTNNLNYLGLCNAGFNDSGFYFIGNGKDKIKIKYPFNKIGEKIYLESERNGESIPLLDFLLNFTFLSKGYLAVHASAFRYNGQGILVMGWTKGGKTESLLSFANHGAEYIGDEWVLVSEDGSKMFGNPVPVAIWEWQFPFVSNLIPKIEFQKRILFGTIHLLNYIFKISTKLRIHKKFPFKFLRDLLPSINRQLNLRIKPEKLFNGKMFNSPSSLDKLILILSWESDDIYVESYEWDKIAESMINSIEAEQAIFWENYYSFKFAFPYSINPFLEEAKSIQKRMIKSAFKDKESHLVCHPYPVNFDDLFEKMEKIIQEKPKNELIDN